MEYLKKEFMHKIADMNYQTVESELLKLSLAFPLPFDKAV